MTAPVNISVLVPVYNVEPYLAQCLESICSQTLRELEVVCVDDASTDAPCPFCGNSRSGTRG